MCSEKLPNVDKSKAELTDNNQLVSPLREAELEGGVLQLSRLTAQQGACDAGSSNW